MKTKALFLLLILLLAGCSEPNQPSISFYLAIQRGNLDQIERHIYWGTDLNQLDPDGNHALGVAAAQGRQTIVKTLLKHGADINLKNTSGHSALYSAILNGRTRLADLLLAEGAQLDATQLLLDATNANTSDRDVIRYLVQHGADMQARDATGQTPLLLAIKFKNHRLARHLVDQGADVNVRNSNNHTALWIAKQYNLRDIAHLLQRQGAIEE